MSDANASSSSSRKFTAMFLAAVALALFFWFFSAISTVVLGILAAAIVDCALSPLLRRVRLPRGLAAALLGLALISTAGALVLGLSLPLAGPIRRNFQSMPQTMHNIDTMLGHWSPYLGTDEPITHLTLIEKLGSFIAPQLLLSRGADVGLGILLWLAFVFIGSIFLLASPPDVLLRPALRVLPPHARANVSEMLEHLATKLRWWLIGTLGGMCVVFSACCLGYGISGVKFFLPLAMLAGLAETVPTVGPACAAVVALLFAASQGSGPVIGVILTYIIVQTLEAYLVLPLIMRGAVQIHPAVTLFSVVLWAKIFGVPGMMLAIPINLTIAAAIEFLYVRPRDRRLSEPRRVPQDELIHS